MPSAPAESAPPPLADNLTSPSFSLRALWDYPRQVFTVVLFFLICLTFSTISPLIARFYRGKFSHASGQRLIRNLLLFWLKISIGLGVFVISFPEVDKLRQLRGKIVSPNHPTLLDAMILLSVLPGGICIMRAGLAKSPFMGGLAKLAGFIANDSGATLIRQGVAKLHEGENLLIFPEGTRTETQEVNPFKHGFALIATRSGAPIQTVLIEKQGRYLGKGVSLFTPTTLPIRYHFHIGEVITPREDEGAQELSTRLEKYFRDHLENTGQDIRLKSPLS